MIDISIPEMPSDNLSEEDKQKLDKMCKGKSCDHIRHMGNHLHNNADKMNEHSRKNITYDQYVKATKRNE